MMVLVPLPFCDKISVKEAARIAGVSGQTIRRWCEKYGIGKRPSTGFWDRLAYEVSLPGLRMVIAQDWEALEAFRSGDRRSDLVARHFEC